MKPDYRIGYTLNDELDVVTECRAYVCDDRSSTWDQLKPDHRYAIYDKSRNGSVWKRIDY